MAHSYDECNKKVITIKPSIDTRSDLIETRAKVPPRKTDIKLEANESLFFNYESLIGTADIIMVDECQFLTPKQIDELREITLIYNINVLCFGLRTDFNTNLFPASQRLFELADEIIEVKTICSVCGDHAGFSAKVEKKDTNSNIEVGWDNFTQVCWKHYKELNS